MSSGSSRVVKYQHVKETLAAEIERGRYHLGERLPSEKQLAEIFAVSIITIRQAVESLSRDGYVEKIQGSGTYVRSLRPIVERSLWGFVFPVFSFPFCAPMAQGLSEIAAAAGIQVLLAASDLEEDRGETIRRMVAVGVQAMAVVASWQRPLDPGPLHELAMTGVPFVYLGEFMEEPTAPCVRGDWSGGARLAVEHLLSLGHQRIAFLAERPSHFSDMMWEGFSAALEQAGVPGCPASPVYAESYEETDVYRAARELLAHSPRPTGIFCAHDQIAQAVYRAAADADLGLPESLSLAAISGMNPSFSAETNLTLVRVPHLEMGREAGRLLLRLMMRSSVQPEIVLPLRLQRGRSSGPAPEASSRA